MSKREYMQPISKESSPTFRHTHQSYMTKAVTRRDELQKSIINILADEVLQDQKSDYQVNNKMV